MESGASVFHPVVTVGFDALVARWADEASHVLIGVSQALALEIFGNAEFEVAAN